MKLYEIDQAITDLVDPETGEILDYEAFEELKMAREEKIEGMALWVKNLDAEAKAIKAEEDSLKARRQSLEKKSKSLKEYLTEILSGDKFTTARVACTFRKAKSVDIQDEAAFIQTMLRTEHYEFLRIKTEINKTAITNAIKEGEEVTGAMLVDNLSLTIK